VFPPDQDNVGGREVQQKGQEGLPSRPWPDLPDLPDLRDPIPT